MKVSTLPSTIDRPRDRGEAAGLVHSKQQKPPSTVLYPSFLPLTGKKLFANICRQLLTNILSKVDLIEKRNLFNGECTVLLLLAVRFSILAFLA